MTLKTNEEYIELFRTAYSLTIKQIIEQKGSRKKIMALEMIWLKTKIKDGAVCDRCHQAKDLTVDHIIPESLLLQFGIESTNHYIPRNYGILCRRCNLFKGNRLDFSNEKTLPLLKEFVDSLSPASPSLIPFQES